MRMNLIDLLRDRAAAQPEAPAFTFLQSGEHEGAAMTWSALDVRSRAIAAAIQSRTAPGDRVLILLPPGLDFIPAFFGALYAGAVAIPAYAPSGSRADRTSARLRGMISDAGVTLVASSTALHARASMLQATVPELAGLPWVEVDAVEDSRAESWRIPRCSGDTLALLQYTSGSTAVPRGVMVTHGNLLHNLAHSAASAGHTTDTVSVSWLPVNHDMGLIDGVLQPVFSGYPAYLMAPAAFLQRPSRWLQAISRYGATHSGGPNFAYDLCVRRVADDERDALDLSTWRIAFNGSEPIRRSTMERFHRAFAQCGFPWRAFRPAYGLAESTLLVTSTAPGEPLSFLDVEPGRSVVSCGAVNGASRVRIVDPTTHAAVADGGVGEIWVASGSVAAGYWNRPRETADTFEGFIDGVKGPYLRTGDLGCIVNRQLFVTGRIKDVLIVRGVKHYPQDIEATAEAAHHALRPGCCAAFRVEHFGGEAVAIAAEVEPRQPIDAQELDGAIDAIRRDVAAVHQVTPASISLVTAGSLPKTTSGKLQRFLCREGVASGNFEILASWSNSADQTGAAPVEHIPAALDAMAS